MNVSYRSKVWQEQILSNLAETPFSLTVGAETFQCRSVEGFWQGLKLKEERRAEVFGLSGLAAKKAGRGQKSDQFEIAGRTIQVGGAEHEALIREAIRQKILQTPRAAQALQGSSGTLTHQVGGRGKPIFQMEQMLMSIRAELFGH